MKFLERLFRRFSISLPDQDIKAWEEDGFGPEVIAAHGTSQRRFEQILKAGQLNPASYPGNRRGVLVTSIKERLLTHQPDNPVFQQLDERSANPQQARQSTQTYARHATVGGWLKERFPSMPDNDTVSTASTLINLLNEGTESFTAFPDDRTTYDRFCNHCTRQGLDAEKILAQLKAALQQNSGVGIYFGLPLLGLPIERGVDDLADELLVTQPIPTDCIIGIEKFRR